MMHKHWFHTALAIIVVTAGLKYARAGAFGTQVASLATTVS